ncbi:MAG TPA: hypothetical protein VGR89_03455, partial [Puia sp.]|nr:hypothetical protein [Puia sp.]
ANLFFDSISAEPSDQRMKIWFPPVKNINTVLMTVDETMAGQGIVTGASVGLNYADFQATQPILIGYSFHGNGSGGYVNDGAFTDYSAALYGASYQVGITYTGTPLPHDAEFGPVTYQGPNQYTIENVTSGLGSYNKVFRIVTPGGGYLSTNPTTSDHFVLGPTGIEYQNFNLAVYNAWNASVASSFANFWVIGVFECYIVGNSVSPTSAQIRFQTNLNSTDPYHGATTYDIYRDVTRQFTSPTLVYSGTAGTFVDNGLSPNHVYYYEYVPMNGGTPIASATPPAYPWFPIVTNH